MEKTVLIISNTADIHTDDLVEACNRQNIKCFRYNTDHFRISGDLMFRVTESCSLKFGEHSCYLPDVDLLIFRRPDYAHRRRKDIEPWLGAMLDKEWETVESALSVLVKGKVMNPIAASTLAQNKIAQLQLAKNFGLDTPETLISTNISDLKQFADKYICITKGIYNSGYLHGGVMRTATTVVVKATDLDTLSPQGVPTLLQQKIDAVAVWRIVTVGEKSFGFRMSGPAILKNTDSRMVEDELEGVYLPVPVDTKEKLKAMCRNIGILYASSDFIEDADGKLWFIDLNPEGQWGAYEHRFNIPISDEIVNLAKT